jgi:hypothetical protein
VAILGAEGTGKIQDEHLRERGTESRPVEKV